MSNLDSPEDIKEQEYCIKWVQDHAKLLGNPVPQVAKKKANDTFVPIKEENNGQSGFEFYEPTEGEKEFEKITPSSLASSPPSSTLNNLYANAAHKDGSKKQKTSTKTVKKDTKDNGMIFAVLAAILVAALAAIGLNLYNNDSQQVNSSAPTNGLSSLSNSQEISLR